jgi:hypothetical protein
VLCIQEHQNVLKNGIRKNILMLPMCFPCRIQGVCIYKQLTLMHLALFHHLTATHWKNLLRKTCILVWLLCLVLMLGSTQNFMRLPWRLIETPMMEGVGWILHEFAVLPPQWGWIIFV